MAMGSIWLIFMLPNIVIQLFAEAFSIPLLFAVLGIIIIVTNVTCWLHPIF